MSRRRHTTGRGSLSKVKRARYLTFLGSGSRSKSQSHQNVPKRRRPRYEALEDQHLRTISPLADEEFFGFPSNQMAGIPLPPRECSVC